MNILHNLKTYRFIIISALCIFIISIITRIIFIESIPANINPDAADTLQTYIQFKYNHNSSFFGFNWNGAPAFNAYIVGYSWELFGESIMGLRFASAFFSSLMITFSFIIFYILTKRLIISFFISLSLAFNPWLLNFSRDGWENVFNGLFLNLIILGLISYFQFKKLKLGIILTSLGCILGFYGYHPGKFFIFSVIFCLLIDIFISKTWKRNFLSIILISLIFLIFTFPQIYATIRYQQKAFDRIQTVSILKKENSLEEAFKNTKNNIQGFILFDISAFEKSGSLNARYLPLNRPPIDIFLLPFYLFGLILCFKKYPYLFFTFIMVLFPVQILSTNTPDGARAIHAISLMYLFIMLGINKFLALLKGYNPNLAVGIISILLICSSLIDLRSYFTWISNNSTLQARRPAVRNSEYSLWESSLENEIKQKKWGFTVGTWEIIAQINNYQQVLSATTLKNQTDCHNPKDTILGFFCRIISH